MSRLTYNGIWDMFKGNDNQESIFLHYEKLVDIHIQNASSFIPGEHTCIVLDLMEWIGDKVVCQTILDMAALHAVQEAQDANEVTELDITCGEYKAQEETHRTDHPNSVQIKYCKNSVKVMKHYNTVKQFSYKSYHPAQVVRLVQSLIKA